MVSPTRIVDDHLREPQSSANDPSQSSQEKSNFDDTSWSLFSTYSKMAEEDDNKMAECWQKDADGVLIFVSSAWALM